MLKKTSNTSANSMFPLASLRSWIELLRREKQIIEVDVEVDPDQEIAEIHRRVIAGGGPALLFNRVKGSPFPVVTNLLGTKSRVDLTFGKEPQETIKRLIGLIRSEGGGPPSIGKLWESRDLFLKLAKLGMKDRKTGPIGEVIDPRPDLEKLPLLKLWPEDGGHFVTLPLVYTQDPHEGTPNLGMYRMQRYGPTTTGMHWQIGKGGGFHFAEARNLGSALPVHVFIGGPPALILSAIAPLPESVPEVLLASFLLGGKLPVLRDPITRYPIPTEAEFVLVGEVSPDEVRPEGPFGDHYGYYSLTHDYPVFHCKKIFRRKDAIYPATVVGKPRQEDFFIGDYLQELLSPLFPVVMPSVIDLWSYGETGFHSLSAAVVKVRYKREAMMSAFRILGEGQLSLTKILLLVDKKFSLQDFPSVLQYVLERCRWETDLYLFSQLSMDTLDYAGPKVNEGSKGVLLGMGDAIRSLPRRWTGATPAGVRSVATFCPGVLVVGGPSYEEDKDFARLLAERNPFDGWQLIVLCDNPEQCAASTMNFLWTAFTRFEPAADLHPKSSRVERSHICFEGPIVLDSRMKPWYPKEVFADPMIAKRVDQRWKEYFPKGGVEMGSSDLGHLSP